MAFLSRERELVSFPAHPSVSVYCQLANLVHVVPNAVILIGLDVHRDSTWQLQQTGIWADCHILLCVFYYVWDLDGILMITLSFVYCRQTPKTKEVEWSTFKRACSKGVNHTQNFVLFSILWITYKSIFVVAFIIIVFCGFCCDHDDDHITIIQVETK